MNKDISYYLRNNWSLIAVLGLLWVTIYVLFSQIMILNHHHFTYILDDTYIHMAMAKNFALYGVWGVTKYGFTSSSSSTLWVLLLSLSYYLFGVNDLIPLYLNVIFASGLVTLVYLIFKRYKLPQWYCLPLLLLMVFLTPIPTLIFSGMETILQIFLIIPFIFLSAKLLTKQEINQYDYILFFLLGILLALVRYEDLLLIGIVFILLLIKRRYITAISLAALSGIPIIIYGMISTSNGWLFFPNSIITKSILFTDLNIFSLNGILQLFTIFVYNLGNYIYLVLLIFICIILFIHYFNKNHDFWEFKSILLVIYILIATAFLIVSYANIKDFFFYYFRYDAYLVVLGLLVVSISLTKYISDGSFRFKKELLPKYLAILLLIFLILAPISFRVFPIINVPQAANNIYEQQYQMGLFLDEYYTGESVAINDLGAVSYLSDVKILDIWSLGSMESLEYIKSFQIYNPEVLSQLADDENVKILIVYDQNFESIPDGWIKVGEWTIPDNKVCSYDTVSFYATNHDEAQKLVNNLREFSEELPSNIKQTYFI